jgi:hypothetical protein
MQDNKNLDLTQSRRDAEKSKAKNNAENLNPVLGFVILIPSATLRLCVNNFFLTNFLQTCT